MSKVPCLTVHMLYKQVGSISTIPLLVPHDLVNTATQVNEVMGVVLIDSSREDRIRVLLGIAESQKIDPTLLSWRHMSPGVEQA